MRTSHMYPETAKEATDHVANHDERSNPILAAIIAATREGGGSLTDIADVIRQHETVRQLANGK